MLHAAIRVHIIYLDTAKENIGYNLCTLLVLTLYLFNPWRIFEGNSPYRFHMQCIQNNTKLVTFHTVNYALVSAKLCVNEQLSNSRTYDRLLV